MCVHTREVTCEVTLIPGLLSLHSPAPGPICCLRNSHTCLRLHWQKPQPESTARELLALAATMQSSPVSSAPAADRGLWHPLCLRRAGKDAWAEPLYLHPSLIGKAWGWGKFQASLPILQILPPPQTLETQCTQCRSIKRAFPDAREPPSLPTPTPVWFVFSPPSVTDTSFSPLETSYRFSMYNRTCGLILFLSFNQISTA